MKKQEHTLTLRISKDIIDRLRQTAQDNYCSVSDVARDILLSGVENKADQAEHVFLQRTSWERAVKTRDGGVCVACGETEDVNVYELADQERGGTYTLSNGATLCFRCSRKQRVAPSATTNGNGICNNGHAVYERVPESWLNKYRRSKEKGKIFWERHLACFLTRRKRTISPIVEWYAETFLREVPEEVIIQTLIELCPTPDIIADFPSRRYTSTDEKFHPPTLIWESKEREG